MFTNMLCTKKYNNKRTDVQNSHTGMLAVYMPIVMNMRLLQVMATLACHGLLQDSHLCYAPSHLKSQLIRCVLIFPKVKTNCSRHAYITRMLIKVRINLPTQNIILSIDFLNLLLGVSEICTMSTHIQH